jgi:hypothetical protein
VHPAVCFELNPADATLVASMRLLLAAALFAFCAKGAGFDVPTTNIASAQPWHGGFWFAACRHVCVPYATEAVPVEILLEFRNLRLDL